MNHAAGKLSVVYSLYHPITQKYSKTYKANVAKIQFIPAFNSQLLQYVEVHFSHLHCAL